MRNFKVPDPSSLDARSPESAEHRLAALTRLVLYARDEAKRLDADVLAFCLDAAIAAAREETQRVLSKGAGKRAGNPSQRSNSEPVH